MRENGIPLTTIIMDEGTEVHPIQTEKGTYLIFTKPSDPNLQLVARNVCLESLCEPVMTDDAVLVRKYKTEVVGRTVETTSYQTITPFPGDFHF